MIPTILGCPLWKGKISKRLAKKYLRKFQNSWMLKSNVQKEMANLDIGDYINDCTGLNGQIKEIFPIYRRIGMGKGAVLIDVDITSANTGCSLCHCGIQPAQSQKDIEDRKLSFAKNWILGEGGETWYGKDSPKHQEAVANAKAMIAILESGGHVTTDKGEMLPEFAGSKFL
jgi:hypothetical protein